MNCQNFENILIDLSRGLLMDAGVRESGLAHADSCARCRARLSVERALNGGLRAVAISAAEQQNAPARVESALLAAFRAQHANQIQTLAATANATHAASHEVEQPAATKVLPASFARAERTNGERAFNQTREARVRRFPNTWLRAAAAVLLIFGAGLLALLNMRQAEPERGEMRANNEANRAASRKIEGEPAANVGPLENNASSSANSSALEPRADASTQTTLASVRTPNAVRQTAPVSYRPAGLGRTPRTGSARYTNASLDISQRGALSEADASASQAEAEITTDFFPLGGASALTASDGGHVVRVELPRSALGAFGLPMNAERTGGRVKADVLLGDDGVARAVRFVR